MWLATLCYFCFALIFLSLRYAILPQIENYRGDIEQMLSASLNLPVEIERIDTHWHGLLPHLGLRGLQIHDKQGRPALGFDNVEADVSWTSLLHFGLRLHRLEIVSPSLTIRRDAQGRIFIAGLQLNTAATDDNAFPEWLLAQKRIVIRDARILWQDELRGAPPLELQHLNFHLQNDGSRHRFGFTADPPRALAARLDIRGDFKGSDLAALDSWQGETYAELDYADLAIWRQWVDYPIELPQGSGGLRLWLGIAQKQLKSLTADIALGNVRVRLAPDLPLLDLQYLKGRLSGKRDGAGLEIGARQLALQTRDGILVEPNDFLLRWHAPRVSSAPSALASALPAAFQSASVAYGDFTANGLDLDALARLAAHLPFDAETRQRLAAVAPHGKVFDLKASWTHQAAAPGSATSGMQISLAHLDKFGLSTRFERLGMQPQGGVPGFEGLSGSIEGNEQGGTLRIASQHAALQLPEVFAEPRIELARIDALINFKRLRKDDAQGADGLEVSLEQLNFAAQPAAGSVSGRYVLHGANSGPGEIDLNARLTRAEASSVWRFIPLVVDRSVRDWLQVSILSGSSDDTTLRLKGDLARFPFDDGSGIFEVKGKFQNASLRYAPDWPQIDHINGELEFVGKRMLIQGNRGTLYGVTLSDVKAQIADLSVTDVALQVTGQAAGPTGDFLRFIEASPVGASIDHFTEDMSAQGNGALNLKLTLPLNHLETSKVEGSYQFAANKLQIDNDLPLLGDVNGRLQFTGDGLKAERVRATLLGMPMVVDVKTVGNGAVAVSADGQLNISELRRQFAHPLLDHLSGNSPWHGSVQVRKKQAEVLIESKLQGISSSLPEPFNKSFNDVLPLRFERKQLQTTGAAPAPAAATLTAVGVPRDQIDATLGHVLTARFLRRHEGERAEKTVWERGVIAVGEPPALPDKGLTLAVNLKKIDADLWRSLLGRRNGANGSDVPAAAAATPDSGDSLLLPTAIVLKTSELIVFGHRLQDLEARAYNLRDGVLGGWRADLRSRDLNGELIWRGQGSGRLTARLKQLSIDDGSAASAVAGADEAVSVEQMPGLDIEVDQLLMRGRPFGKLKLLADNRDGAWDARLDIENDDGKLSGTGKWRPSMTQPDTQLKFSLTAKHLEKLLGRVGYPDVLRRGRATLEGQVAWNGAPFAIDYPTLSGNLKVDAANGQFNKLEPGVGRLLGILSLQSLPRRITLDFRDVFSEGFAFDSISGQVSATRGILSSQDLQILGPAAKVLMSGSVNLPRETQNLKVRVQPAVGESLAVGAMLAHPAAGALAWIAQKILRDPLDQAFAFEYAVTGSWADPKVEKLSGPQPQPGAPLPSPAIPAPVAPVSPSLPAAPIVPSPAVAPAPALSQSSLTQEAATP